MKMKMLNWAARFNIFCFLDNQQYAFQPHKYECLLGADAVDFVTSTNIIELDDFLDKNKNWVFGHLSYDLKDSIYFPSHKKNRVDFPPFYFFIPRFTLCIKNQELLIIAEEPDKVYQSILSQPIIEERTSSKVVMQHRLDRAEYIQKIKSLQAHILKGDCYEINFCQEFFSESAHIDPLLVFQKLIKISPNPFSALYKINDKFLLCASPERFLVKEKTKITSQPMKGTIKRNLLDAAEDEIFKHELKKSGKDQSENVMVVDLVRNDLTRICKDNSVKVEELFSIYSYPQVHQMISTVSGDLKNDIKFSEIIKATFPMGSMTGAPKYRVMKLIDQYEDQGRGIFSGSVGYISPDGDFDLNVVIRSIMYNATEEYLSYQVGSGITFYSDPQKEWDECLLKAEAIKKVLDE